MIQFYNIFIYMNSVNEKEKKLQFVLNKLKNLNMENSEKIDNLSLIESKKNQLEIEKNNLENNFQTLKIEYDKLLSEMEELKQKKTTRKKKS